MVLSTRLKMSILATVKRFGSYGGQLTLSTQLIKPDYLEIHPPTQRHSFFRNLPHLFNCKMVYWLGKLEYCHWASKITAYYS